MSSNYQTILWVMIAGLSTGLGAVPIFFKKNYSRQTLDMGMGFSAGVMLVASFIALILPGIEASQNLMDSKFAIWPVIIGLILGYVSIITFHRFIPHEHIFKYEPHGPDKKLSKVTLIVLAIALHNFPEGLTVGVGFASNDPSGGISIALAIALQNMPEGLVVAFGMLSEGANRSKAFMMALLSGLVEPVAAAFGYFTTQLSVVMLPVSLGFAGGAMLFVICQEIFPELFKEGHEKSATFGVILGILTMLLIDYYV